MLTKYNTLIRSMVWKVAGRQITREDVDDLVSAINLELMERKLSAFIPGRGMELSTYIGMIAKRFTIDEMRKRHEFTRNEGDLRDTEISDNTSNALALLIRKEQQSRVRRAISDLPPREHDLICAMMEDDFSVEKYAVANGMSSNAVYILRCRALRLLKARVRSGDED